MKFRFAPVLLAAVTLVAFAPAPVRATPANTLIEMWSQFRYCLRSARLENGVDLTVRFSFKRDGSLTGEPKVSYFNLRGDTEAERRSAEAVSRALDHCLPVSISDELGGAIAGRPMWIRLHGHGRERES